MSKMKDHAIGLLTANTCTDPKWVALKAHRAELGNLHRQVLIAKEWWDYCDHFEPELLAAASSSLAVAMNNYRLFKRDAEAQIEEIYVENENYSPGPQKGGGV